jgi:UDP-N-acetylmuramoylalanine--D-glutamate ligase
MTGTQQPTLVLGLGRSGTAAARLLLRSGCRVVGYDRDPDRGREIEGLEERLSGETLPDFDRFARVIQSPGVPLTSHPKIVPEVELAAEHLKAPLIGVTGTNGKSTTVVLIGEMLRATGLRVAAGGNLGTALCELVELPADWVVAELSSFQLEHAQRLDTAVAVLLNLAPDHLDRHGTLVAYGEAKARLATLSSPETVVVCNAEDRWAREAAARAQGRVFPFSARRELTIGAFVEEEKIVVVENGTSRIREPISTLSPAARTPIDNALAASAAALWAGASPEGVVHALSRFRGLPHRLEVLGTCAGARYVNDSKATNPVAAAGSLAAWDAPIAWIAGGRNKGLDLSPLVEATSRVRLAVVYGEAGPDLEKVLEGRCPVVRVEAFDDAFAAVAARAQPGDTVLLSPGCASQDQFGSFEERGERFTKLARAAGLEAQEAPC